MSAKYHICKYPQVDARGDTHWFGSGFVSNDEDVEEMIEKRGLDEKYDGYGAKDSFKPICVWRYLLDDEIDKALHAATFLGFIGLKSGVLTVDEVLGDYGFIHEIAHYVDNTHDSDNRAVELRDLALEVCKIENRLFHLFENYQFTNLTE